MYLHGYEDQESSGNINILNAAGKIGWLAKGVVYAILGALCCKMGSNGKLADTSPQVWCIGLLNAITCTYLDPAVYVG